MMSTQPSMPFPEEADEQSDSERPLTVTSQEVLQGRRELWIEHEGQIYRLRVTSRGKLYLTK
jgi:hemin uptake protein HemP